MKARILMCTSVTTLFAATAMPMWVASPSDSARPTQIQERHYGKLTGLARNGMSPAHKQQIVANYGQVPMNFEANRGQTNPLVRFVSRGCGYSLFLTDKEAVLALNSSGLKGASQTMAESSKSRINSSRAVLRFKLMGANLSPQVTGVQELVGKSNYFRGNDPSQWRTNVPTYAKVKYQNVYPGIDLLYHGNQRQLEYDFVVAPGADLRAIRLSFQGARRMQVDAHGDLVLHTAAGDVREHKPVVYQEIAGSRQAIAGNYVLHGNSEVSFAVAPYDPRQPLVIDPVLSYSSYLGGKFDDWASGIGVDSAGNTYVTGFTSSGNFPTITGAFQATLGGPNWGDVFVTKLNASGSALIYSTYLGGDGLDEADGIAVDSAGSAYLTGLTNSTNFPTTQAAFQRTIGGLFDAFATKLNADGSALIYSTYLGGSGADGGRAIAVDSAGNAYLTGSTSSANFPATMGAFQTTFAGVDGYADNAFVTKLNANGSALSYSTFLAGSGGSDGTGLALDSAGNAYVSGYARSGFPTTAGVYQTTVAGTTDAFVTKFNATGSVLIYSTYLGGRDNDFSYGIAVDSVGNAYLTGETLALSNDFPITTGAFQTTRGGGSGDAFVTKFNADASAIIYSTFLSGAGGSSALGIALDSAGNAYVTGVAGSGFPTTTDAFQTHQDFSVAVDAFVTKLNATGSSPIYSTYLGGSAQERSTAIALDSMDNAYLAGQTSSKDFPTTAGAFQTTYDGGNTDAFVAKIAPPDFSISASAFSPSSVSRGGSSTATLTVTAIGGFSNPVALSCSVTPSPALAPKCSVPTSATPATPATFTVNTTGPTGALLSTTSAGLLYAICVPLLGLAVGSAGSGRKKKGMWKLSAVVRVLNSVLIAGLVFAIGCGGGGVPRSGGTPSGTYTITVTGTTSGSLVHSTDAMLTVQ